MAQSQKGSVSSTNTQKMEYIRNVCKDSADLKLSQNAANFASCSGKSSARERLMNKNKPIVSAKKLDIVSYKQQDNPPKRKRQPKLNNMKQSYFTKPSYANVNLDENVTSEREESNFNIRRKYEYTSL